MATSEQIKSQLVSDLYFRAAVAKDEVVYAKVPSLLDVALLEHTHQSVTDYALLPTAEHDLVLILAHIRVCYARASEFSKQSSTKTSASAQTFGYDRDTPFTKTMDLIKQLRKEYDQRVNELSAAAQGVDGDIIVGELVVTESFSNLRVPVKAAPAVIPPRIFQQSVTVSTVPEAPAVVIVGWGNVWNSAIQSLTLWRHTASPVYCPWEEGFTAPGAEKLVEITCNNRSAFKTTQGAGEMYYVLIATDTAGHKIAGNELAIKV